MVKQPIQSEDDSPNLSAPLHFQNVQEAKTRFHDDPDGLEAVRRFEKNPTKCFQRHIREVRGEQAPHAVMDRDGWNVKVVDNKTAAAFIRKYEWLRTMGAGTIICVGGFDKNGEMFGVECFGKIGQRVGTICQGETLDKKQEFAEKTAYLMRGACAPWAHKKAGSWLIRQACKLLYQTKGWEIFFAYSDAAAGEVGIVYQRCHWHYVGTGLGKGKNGAHFDYDNPIWPDSKLRKLSSYKINHGRLALAEKLGTPIKDREKGFFRPWLVKQGWQKIVRPSHDKGKYVWFEGPAERVGYLTGRCKIRFGLDSFLPYPNRAGS